MQHVFNDAPGRGCVRAGLAVLLGLLVMLGPAAVAAKEPPVALPIGMNYLPMRRAMVAAGYRPYRVIRPTISFNSVNRPAYAISPLRVRFPEMAWCTGVELNYCIFFFKRTGKVVRNEPDIVEITTMGEEPDALTIIAIQAASEQSAEQEYANGTMAIDKAEEEDLKQLDRQYQKKGAAGGGDGNGKPPK